MASSAFPWVLRVAGCGLFVLLLGPWLRTAMGETHTAAMLPHLFAQIGSANIYSDTVDAKAEIRAAMAKAAREHKHVILDFGGNWCSDCQLLNIYFHDPGNASLLQTNYVLVDVSVGEYDKNLDIARKYGIPLNKGVPALVVLDGQGRVLYAQRNAEFEKMNALDSAAVTTFLEKWKPGARTVPPAKAPTAKTINK